MTPISNVRAVRPVAIAPEYKAWKVSPDGTHYPLRIDASTLKNVVYEVQDMCGHKEQFAVLECDGSKQVLRIYQIKQGKPEYRYVNGAPVRIEPRKADLVTTLAVDAYAPVEPFQWTPGCDVVGAERGVISA